MPGAIQVSVLEFMALQSSSSLAQMSIKISMGKREHQTWDKGEFSFPLTTLRDNLIVTLQDAQGKEISHTVIETRLVIEKGIWDDIFQFEGGGHVHMKLQFVLSEEDRHRIRVMRELALRKKRNELLNSEVRSPTHATTVGSNIASSLQPNHEVSDSHKSLLQSEVIQTGLSSNKEGNSFCSEANKTNRFKDTSSTTPMSPRFDIHQREVSHRILVEKGSTNAPTTTIHSEEASCLESSGSVVAAKNQAPAELKLDGANDPEKQSPVVKTHSKIRNMISAFENSLNQDMRPNIRPAPIGSQSSKRRLDVSSKSKHYTGDMQQAPTYIRKREDQIGFVRALAGSTSSREAGQSEELRAGHIHTTGTTVDLKDKVEVMHKVDTHKVKKTSEKLERASTSERASILRRMLIEKGTRTLSNLFAARRHSGDNSLKQNNGREIQPKGIQDVNIQGNSDDEPHSSECYGSWIFPDGGKRLCITTGGKQIMDLMESCHAEASSELGKMSYPTAENEKEVFFIFLYGFYSLLIIVLQVSLD
ncbi:uncharacterized protein LOC110639610 [Hevea brasiliensis]|uniref:uncharacterized protein LOC110639610 n=1 Tax=Hevea brasiliensis TaxID=3981 RepID=UPI0025CE9A3B|nr:uncharacterized protein LOC110639610 [Hevea brasiliensis]